MKGRRSVCEHDNYYNAGKCLIIAWNKLTCDSAFFCHAFLCFRDTTYESADSVHEHVTMEMNPSYAIVSMESILKN